MISLPWYTNSNGCGFELSESFDIKIFFCFASLLLGLFIKKFCMRSLSRESKDYAGEPSVVRSFEMLTLPTLSPEVGGEVK